MLLCEFSNETNFDINYFRCLWVKIHTIDKENKANEMVIIQELGFLFSLILSFRGENESTDPIKVISQYSILAFIHANVFCIVLAENKIF